jgi:hypothetical protein
MKEFIQIKSDKNFNGRWPKFFKPSIRKLKAGWTLEKAQGITAFHQPGIENEIIAAMAKEIRDTIDQDIINSLMGAKI